MHMTLNINSQFEENYIAIFIFGNLKATEFIFPSFSSVTICTNKMYYEISFASKIASKFL